MALAIDGSTPAVVTQTSPTTPALTTGSFTPPSGSLLLPLWSANNAAGLAPASPAITDNLGGHLTYNLVDWKSRATAPTVDGQAADWWAAVGSSATMTVTVTNGDGANNNNQAALALMVLTGQDPVTPTGAHGKSGSTSAASIAQSYTATATGSWGFIAVCDWDALGSMTAGSGCTLIATGTIPTTQISYGIFRRTTADGTNGGTTTLNVNLAGTSTHVSWVYVEVVPAATATATNSAPLTVPGVRRPGSPGSSLILNSTAVSQDAQPGARITGAPPGLPGQRGSAVVLFSQAPSRDFQQPSGVIGVAVRPPATGSALVLGSRSAPPPLTDTPPPALVVGAVRPPRPPGTAVVLASEAPSPDAQPAPLIVGPGLRFVGYGITEVLGVAPPVISTDAPTDVQPKPLLGLPGISPPLRSGLAVTLGSVADPAVSVPPTPLVAALGQRWPMNAGATVLTYSVPQTGAPIVAVPGTLTLSTRSGTAPGATSAGRSGGATAPGGTLGDTTMAAQMNSQTSGGQA